MPNQAEHGSLSTKRKDLPRDGGKTISNKKKLRRGERTAHKRERDINWGGEAHAILDQGLRDPL